MIPVSIDPSDFIQMSMMSETEVKNFTGVLLDNLALRFQESWMDEVKSNLHSTRAEYMRGMFVERPDDNTIIFGITARQSKLALDLELGKGAFDEKPGFEKSPKKTMKRSGVGWYISVPFRHAVPGSVGESTAFTSVMPQSVYKIAKSQSSPIIRNQLPASLQVRGVRPALQIKDKTIPAYRHKSAKYEALVRVPDEREGGRSQYVTFRRVSDLSDWNAWFHPGLKPQNLLGKALTKTDITSVVRRARIDFFKNR